MYTVHGTRKLLDRLKTPQVPASGPAPTVLGDWYATVLAWRPQLVLFVNTSSFFPVFVPFAPAVTVLARFPDAMAAVFDRFGLDPRFVTTEVAEMGTVAVAKTRDRRTLGVMNELVFMAETRVADGGHDPRDLVGLSIVVADTLISPLYKDPARGNTPGEELRRLAALALRRS